MATAKKKPATAKSTSSGPTAPSAAAASSSASPSSTTAGGAAGGGSNKKKSPPSAAAAAAPTAVAAAPSDKTNTTAKKDIASSPSLSPPPDETQMTRCTEKDVLLGRGKRVSEWPGNIHFRQVVNRYREEYATAERANKVKIAAAVIAAVQNVGGRFVREGADTANTGRRSWYVVSHDRAVEKTCQALREKEKANPPTVSPFVGGDDMDYDDDGAGSPLRQKRSRLSPAGSPSEGSSPPRTKRKILQHQAAAAAAAKKNDETSSENEETSSDDDDDDSSDSDDDDDSASTSEEDTEEDRKHSNAKITKPSPAAAAAAAAAAASMAATEQAKLIKGNNASTSIATMTASPSASASPEEVALVMMNRLRSFWSTHGHAAVPPIWPRDQKLADWCIQQRQLHREISVVANNSSSSSSPIRSNQEDSQESAEPLEKESSSDQKMAGNGASEQNGTANEEEEKKNAAVDKNDDTVAAAEEMTAKTTTAPTTTATTTTATASTLNDHVNNKQQQQAEPYRRGSPAELRRIEALNRLGFCWDYAAWHWEHQYQLLVAQVARPPAVAKQDETQQAAVLNKITGGNKSDDATEKGKSQDISGTQDDMKNDAMEVDRAPAKKVDTEQMDVDKESTPSSNGNINETTGISENDNAVEIDQHDDGKKDVPTDDTQEAKGAAATSASPACHNQGVKDGILSTILTDDTLEWIDDQQDQYHNQGHHLVSKERRAKLQAMGIYF